MDTFLKTIAFIGIFVTSTLLIQFFVERTSDYIFLGIIICGLILSFLLYGLAEVIVLLQKINSDIVKLCLGNDTDKN